MENSSLMSIFLFSAKEWIRQAIYFLYPEEGEVRSTSRKLSKGTTLLCIHVVQFARGADPSRPISF